MPTTRLAMLLGALAAVALSACSQEDYYCDDRGCYFCDGLGCRNVPGPDRSPCDCDLECTTTGSVCTSLGCAQQCTAAGSSCPQGTVCEGGLCLNPAEDAVSRQASCECATNDDCEEYADGEDLECRGGECVPTPIPVCSDTKPCPSPQVCVQGQCRTPDGVCRFDTECRNGRVCVNQQCVDPCAGTDCPTGSTCVRGYCQENPPECSTDNTCPGGRICINGTCWEPCTSDAMCGPGRYCAPDGRCRQDDRPDPACSSDNDCAGDAVCLNGLCRSPCTANPECPLFDRQFQFCVNMFCATSDEFTANCTTAADCDANQRCVNGSCSN